MAVCLQSCGGRVEARQGLGPNADESFVADFRRWRRIEGSCATHMIAMETPHDVNMVTNTKRIGQRFQRAVGEPAFDPVAVILQQAQKARVVAFNVSTLVHGQLNMPAQAQKMTQSSIGLTAA